MDLARWLLQARSNWLEYEKRIVIMAKAKAPRERLQALLIAQWQEMGELSLLHHRQVQLLLDTLRREKELVSVQLIELLLTDLYDQEFPSH